MVLLFNPSFWFICGSCREAFPSTDELMEHKMEKHAEDCVGLKWIVFEESILDHEIEDKSGGNVSSELSNQQSRNQSITFSTAIPAETCAQQQENPLEEDNEDENSAHEITWNEDIKPRIKIEADEVALEETEDFDEEWSVKIEPTLTIDLETEDNFSIPVLPPENDIASSSNFFPESVNTSQKNRKDLSCTHCPAKFSTSSKLINHKLTHRVTKPFKCRFCDAFFHYKVDRMIHKQYHVGDQFKCGINRCQYSAKSNRQLLNHTKGKHSNVYLDNSSNIREFEEEETSSPILNNVEIGSGPSYHQDVVDLSNDSDLETCNLKIEGRSRKEIPVLEDAIPSSSQFVPESVTMSQQNRNRKRKAFAFRCSRCPSKFPTKPKLKNHQLTHRWDHPLKCRLCDAFFQFQVDLGNHAQYHTSDQFKCAAKRCSYSAISRRQLITHTKSKHINFYPKNNIREYVEKISTVPNTGGSNYDAYLDQDQVNPTNGNDVVLDGDLEEENSPFAIPVPDGASVSNSHFSPGSIKTFRKNQKRKGKDLKCSHCPAKFNAVGKLKNHQRTHRLANPVKCRFCDAVFHFKVDLANHKTYHVGDKFKCDVKRCHYSAKTRRQLKIHTYRKHSNSYQNADNNNIRESNEEIPVTDNSKAVEPLVLPKKNGKKIKKKKGKKPFECKICDERFATKKSLASHTQTHSSLVLVCEYCSDGFKTRRQMKNHMSSHQMNSPFFVDTKGSSILLQQL